MTLESLEGGDDATDILEQAEDMGQTTPNVEEAAAGAVEQGEMLELLEGGDDDTDNLEQADDMDLSILDIKQRNSRYTDETRNTLLGLIKKADGGKWYKLIWSNDLKSNHAKNE